MIVFLCESIHLWACDLFVLVVTNKNPTCESRMRPSYHPCRTTFRTRCKHNDVSLPLVELSQRPLFVRFLWNTHDSSFTSCWYSQLFTCVSSSTAPVAPKQVLSSWYSKAPRSHQLSNINYLTWRDDAMPHLVKYTSIFVCPLTGEVFASGRHGNPDAFEERSDCSGERTVFWYSTLFLLK